MLYTPHARVFTSAVPVYSGSSIASFIQVGDPQSAALAWEFAERDHRRAEATVIALPKPSASPVEWLLQFVRAQRAAA